MTKRRGPETDRACLGWPDIGSCSRPAQTDGRHRPGRWSRHYCEDCDELRLLHSPPRRKSGPREQEHQETEATE